MKRGMTPKEAEMFFTWKETYDAIQQNPQLDSVDNRCTQVFALMHLSRLLGPSPRAAIYEAEAAEVRERWAKLYRAYENAERTGKRKRKS